MDRRQFLKTSALLTGGALLPKSSIVRAQAKAHNLVLVKNGQPAEMVSKALDLLGGIQRFVATGEVVLLKPNISWDRAPEYAATTNPELVAEMVRQCRNAGAKKVIVLDNPCNDARRSYASSRIPEYAEKAGAEVKFMRENQYVETPIPNGTKLKSWLFHQDALTADKIIYLPILKHHRLSGATIGFKNVMGLIGGNRGRIHFPFAENIVDLNRRIVPVLTVVDAIRVLKRNGPGGGNLHDVEQMNTVVAGIDRVLVDAWGARIFGHDPYTYDWLKLAHAQGLGEIDTEKRPPFIFDFKA